jgi:hypothetical protein
MNKTATFRQEVISGHKSQSGVDTKIYLLTDRQSKCNFDCDSGHNRISPPPAVFFVAETTSQELRRSVSYLSSVVCCLFNGAHSVAWNSESEGQITKTACHSVRGSEPRPPSPAACA